MEYATLGRKAVGISGVVRHRYLHQRRPGM
jgi:hypothetical protein